MDVETYSAPPELDEDEDGDDESARISVSVNDVGENYHDASVQLFGKASSDPDKIAEAILRCALAVGHLSGPDVAWAVARRLTSFDGSGQT